MKVSVIPDLFAFKLRKIKDKSNYSIEWETLTLTKEDLIERTRVHVNPDIDVAVIKINDLVFDVDKIRKTNSYDYINNFPMDKSRLPGRNKIKVEAASDVLIIGYPQRYYDETNLFPTIKAGIIASSWGKNFNDEPCFLIDAKLFPGSSGSLVVSKPIDFVIDERQIYQSEIKKYAFLGIYSADIQDSGDDYYQYNIGKVWYGNLVEEIIEKGIKLDSIAH